MTQPYQPLNDDDLTAYHDPSWTDLAALRETLTNPPQIPKPDDLPAPLEDLALMAETYMDRLPVSGEAAWDYDRTWNPERYRVVLESKEGPIRFYTRLGEIMEARGRQRFRELMAAAIQRGENPHENGQMSIYRWQATNDVEHPYYGRKERRTPRTSAEWHIHNDAATAIPDWTPLYETDWLSGIDD